MTREIVYTGFTTLDGAVDSPGGVAEGHPGGGWVFDTPFVEEAYSLKADELAETSALMFGRRSYEAFSSFWPTSEDHVAYLELPKYVVSSTLAESAVVDGWGETTVLRSTADVPVLVGAGKRVFSLAQPGRTNLQLRDSAAYSNGVLKLVYDVVR